MDFARVKESLEKRGFTVAVFETAAEAADYLDTVIDGVSVGIGGSMTVEELGLAPRLAAHNAVYWHWHPAADSTAAETRQRAAGAEVYLTSVNGLAESGEIVNIDGTGNRVASMLYGHQKVYFIAGRNKLAEDFDAALRRARNVAAPLNAKRLGIATPCVAAGHCCDCGSPQRICRGLTVLWERMGSCGMEVVLVDEPLGY